MIKRLPWVRRVGAGLLALLGVVALAGAWVGVRGLNARDHLRQAAVLMDQLRWEMAGGDTRAAAATLASLQRQTARARAQSDDPGWRLGRGQVVADDLAAVSTVAAALDDLAREGLPPLVETAGSVDLGALTPRAGRVDLAPLRAAAPRLAAADDAVRRARDRVAGIDPDGLADRLRAPLRQLRDSLDRAATQVATAARTAQLLPGMLGADGPRSYLVVFQNLAEVRATGGLPGAFVTLRADRGAIRIVDQSTASALGRFARPVLPLDPARRALYTDRLGTYPADVNFAPHFPTAAQLLREMYRRRSGRTVDGVLATDPVAMAGLLRVLGPVPVPGGPTLTADNAVRVLLSETYAHSASSTAQDRYFAAAARAAFQALTTRRTDPVALAAELARAAGERRLLLWSADPAQQRLIAGTVLEGVLPTSDGRRPTVGVFLNDGSGAKLGYYLRAAAELSLGACRPDGRRELLLRFSLGSTAPASGLSEYVLGAGLAGDPYTVRTNVALYTSPGGAISRVLLDGARARLGTGLEGRRAVGLVTVDLRPGQTRVLEATLLTGVPAGGWGTGPVTPRLWTTPGVTPWRLSVRSADGCDASK